MGTWTLWIAFNVVVAVLLLLDLGILHRRAHAVSIREASLESISWVALSIAFGTWIHISHGHALGLEFFTGYLIEKSLSVDNVFIFLLIFRFFRVDDKYQHRLLFWGVLGALVMRGIMIGVGNVLIQRFEWILYVFGAFLLYSGFKLFGVDHSVDPYQNPVIRWVKKVLPMTSRESGQHLFVREAGRWLATPLFLVVIVLEITDLVFAADSIPAVFGVTHDPFIVYTSNVCAILGLRAFYFLLAGILPYFQYLDEGLAVVLMFIGAKMLAEPFIHIPTGASLAIVAVVIAVSVLISVLSARLTPASAQGANPLLASSILDLSSNVPERRDAAAQSLFGLGMQRVHDFLTVACNDAEFAKLIVRRGSGQESVTVGIAVAPATFEQIRAAHGSVRLAHAPADQDVMEFELHFPQHVQLDILTTIATHSGGAIARFLNKFGEGIQQVEIDVTDVERATAILRTSFNHEPIYPVTRLGADGTRVNFFLMEGKNKQKVLVELVEQPKTTA